MNFHHSDSLLAYILAFFLLSSHDIDTTLLWKDPEGLQTIKIVVAKRIKAWKDGLCPFQEQHIVYSPFLFFAISQSASTLKNIPRYQAPARKHTVGLDTTPTKGLACNDFELKSKEHLGID